MSAVIDVQMVMTVHVESVKLEQELLNDGLSLEGDDTVLVPLIIALQHHTIHCPGDARHEVTLLVLPADVSHQIWKSKLMTLAPSTADI